MKTYPERKKRSITLTCNQADMNKVIALKSGKVITIECVNDIVSSLCRGMVPVRGMPHEYNRRYALLSRAYRGYCRTVYVRTAMGFKIKATLKHIHDTKEDASAFKVDLTI